MVNNERLRMMITREAGTLVVAIVGDLDVYAAGDARAHLDEAIDRAVAHGIDRIVVDGAGLGFCDSTGLSVMMKARDSAAQRHVVLVVRNLTEKLQELVTIAGLDALLADDR